MPYKDPAKERARQEKRRHDPKYKARVHAAYLKRKANITPEKKRAQLAQQRAWGERNPDKIRAGWQRYQKKHPERLAEASHRWQQAHKARVAYNTRRRKARKRAQIHPDIDWVKEREFFWQAQYLTEHLGERYVVDHIIPIIFGGWHHHDNLQILPNTVNSRKRENPFWEVEGYKSWRDVPQHLWPKELMSAYLRLLI